MQNTPTASLKRSQTPLMSDLDMTLKKSFEEFPVMLELLRCGEPGYCRHFPRVVASDRVLSMGETELSWVLMLN